MANPSQIVGALALNVGSSNSSIRQGGEELFEALLEDQQLTTALVQPLCHQATYGSVRARAYVLNVLIAIAERVFEERPAVIKKHAF